MYDPDDDPDPGDHSEREYYDRQQAEEGPSEGDVTTEDHRQFYRDGDLWLEVPANVSTSVMWKRIDAKMKREGFFPNVWFVSDHGNAHLMERPKRKGGSHYAKERKRRVAQAKIAKIARAAEKKYGTPGSLISGGFYEGWPTSVKNKIRKLLGR